MDYARSDGPDKPIKVVFSIGMGESRFLKNSRLVRMLLLFAALGQADAGDTGPVKCRLLSAHETYQADSSVLVGVELSMQPGWHVYWVNPGDAGMATSIELTMPDGWTHGPIPWPVPIKFQNGALRGFGYEGDVLVPIRLSPGRDFGETAEVTVKVAWLACNEDACVPGSAELRVRLQPGAASPTSAIGKLAQAEAGLPQEDRSSGFSVTQAGDSLHLSLPASQGRDCSKVLGFPETSQTIENETVRFTLHEGVWRAKVKKNEFLAGEATRLSMVIAGECMEHPIRVFWEKP